MAFTELVATATLRGATCKITQSFIVREDERLVDVWTAIRDYAAEVYQEELRIVNLQVAPLDHYSALERVRFTRLTLRAAS